MTDLAEYVIERAGQQFKGLDFRDLLQPGVYLFLAKGLPLYVGQASSLLSRAASKRHKQAEQARAECDKLLLYPCVSHRAALSLESLLISKLQPKYNWRKRSAVLRDRLGYAESTASAIQHSNSLLLSSVNTRNQGT